MALSIEELLRALSPEVLRGQFEIPYGMWREEFVPRFLATDSYPAMMVELTRFTGRILSSWFGGRVAWPPEHAEATARRLLNLKLGDGLHPRAGEFAAMQICRHGDDGGVRHLLDVLTRALLDEAVERYLDSCLLSAIYRLPLEESTELARQYQARFEVVPGLELDRPASIAMRWRQVIHLHARKVLYG